MEIICSSATPCSFKQSRYCISNVDFPQRRIPVTTFITLSSCQDNKRCKYSVRCTTAITSLINMPIIAYPMPHFKKYSHLGIYFRFFLERFPFRNFSIRFGDYIPVQEFIFVLSFGCTAISSFTTAPVLYTDSSKPSKNRLHTMATLPCTNNSG